MLGLGTRRLRRAGTRGVFSCSTRARRKAHARLKQTRAGVSLFKNDDKRTAVEALRYDGPIEDHEDPEMLLDLMEERTLALFEAYGADATGVIEAAPTAGSRPEKWRRPRRDGALRLCWLNPFVRHAEE